jgi:protein ImuB
MTRIACLLVPLFPLAARLRAEPELAGETVAVCEGNGAAARIVAASRPARRLGVRAGMTLAQARGILPSLIARGRDPSSERSAHEALLEVAWTLSPQVEDAADELVFADVSGMERLYPGAAGERDLGQATAVAAESLDLPLRVGVAGTKLAARVAAHQPSSPTVVPAGEERRFLAPLPLGQLELDRRLLATLARWGLASIGDLARLPADRVASRLGEAGAHAHQAACGVDPRPLVPHHPPPALAEGLELEWAVVTIEPLLAAVGQSLERARYRLERQELACAELGLELSLEPEGAEHRTIRLPAPTRDMGALLALVRLELEARPPRGPVVAFTCLLQPDRPRRGQLTLFGAPEIHPDRLAATLARLAARLGPDRVGSPRTVDGHRPERADSVPFDPPPPPKLQQPPRRGRGLLVVRVLRPPVPLEVIVEEVESSSPLPECDANAQSSTLSRATGVNQSSKAWQVVRNAEQPPASSDEPEPPGDADNNSQLSTFNVQRVRLVSVASVDGATPRIQGLVRVAAGPWSLEEGWWTAEPVERDYWDVELSGGGLYRIFRDRATGEWLADGMYD